MRTSTRVVVGAASVAAGVALLLLPATAGAAPTVLANGWTFTDLNGTTAGHGSAALDINDSGVVVGYLYDAPTDPATATFHAARLDGSSHVRLDDRTDDTVATAVNASGQVVGARLGDPEDLTGYEALSFAGGTATSLGEGLAHDINDTGVVVGFSHEGGKPHAVQLAPTRIDLDPSLAGDGSEAIAINNAGAIVGFRAETPAAARFDGDSPEAIAESLPNFLVGGLSESGLVVGTSLSGDGLLVTGGVPANLGKGPGGSGVLLSDVNDAGLIIGSTLGDPGFADSKPVISQGGTLALLVEPAAIGFEAMELSAVNRSGQIVGTGITCDDDGRCDTHAVRFDPPAVTTSTTAGVTSSTSLTTSSTSATTSTTAAGATTTAAARSGSGQLPATGANGGDRTWGALLLVGVGSLALSTGKLLSGPRR